MVAREAVHNAVKHARARRIVVRLERRGGLALVVEDDGVDIARNRVPGMGLRIMEYRCKIIGGVLGIAPGLHAGTCVTCKLPAKAAPPRGARGPVD
jgi:signal transduction histidine kinase